MTGCKPEMRPDPPRDYNVVLISVDTLRADRLNCYGYREREVSPNIDALAADGILFENHITASPWTTPAHLSMLTSLYPTAHGVTQSFREIMGGVTFEAKFNRLAPGKTTLAEVLRECGYATGAFTAGATVDPKIGFGQGFDVYDTSMFKLGAANMGVMYRWMDEHAAERFFLFWHHFEVHAPYLCPDYLEEVLPAETAARVSDQVQVLAVDLEGHNPAWLERSEVFNRYTGFLRQHLALKPEVCEALYVGGVRSADRWFGAFVQELRARDLYDRSLIIFTSDHGEEFAEHNPTSFYDEHGHSLYEEMLRVPLIIKLPNQEHAGRRVTSAVRMIDIMPTVLDVLGIAAMDDSMQGSSLRPLWEQTGPHTDRIAVSESLSLVNEKKGVRTERYKLILTIDAATVKTHGRAYLPEQPRRVELYDLRRDPAEQRNLLNGQHDAEIARVAEALAQHLREHVKARGPAAERVSLDEETVESLRALGYVE
jgi:arylsulfatase A-like enzyme